MADARSLPPAYYEALRRLTLELAGIELGTDSEFLVETRLAALARQEGYEDLAGMIQDLFSAGQTRLAVSVVSALLERDMRFFTDKPGFTALAQTVWPELIKTFSGEPLDVLVYGCGTGQDAYSIAIALSKLEAQYPELMQGNSFKVTGLDYPSRGLKRAQAGRYTHFEIQRGLPARDLVQYFKCEGEDWVVKDSLRRRLEFKDFHLLSDLKPLGSFNLVVMRNSLSRYAANPQMRILRSLGPIVKPGGYLMLGSTENLGTLNFGLDPVPGLSGFFKRGAIRHQEMPPAPPESAVG